MPCLWGNIIRPFCIPIVTLYTWSVLIKKGFTTISLWLKSMAHLAYFPLCTQHWYFLALQYRELISLCLTGAYCLLGDQWIKTYVITLKRAKVLMVSSSQCYILWTWHKKTVICFLDHGSCRFCECYFDTYHLTNDCCAQCAALNNHDVSWWHSLNSKV